MDVDRARERGLWDASVDTLAGLGPSAVRALARVSVRTIGDLLFLLPVAAVDLRAPLVGEALMQRARVGDRAPIAVLGQVTKAALVPMRGRRAIRVGLAAEGVTVELWWFFYSAMARALSGEIVAVGVASPDAKRPNVLRMAHPRIFRRRDEIAVEPLHRVPNVASARIAAALREAVEKVDAVTATKLDPFPEQGALADVLRATHAPRDLAEHVAGRAALRRKLAFAEACWVVRRRIERDRQLARARAPRLPRAQAAIDRVTDALGFTLTGAQRRAIDEVSRALDAEQPSRTLLTGDVGSGKTVVILAAIAQAVAARRQVALLAPTTVLADQYMLSTRVLDARIARLPRAAKEQRRVREGLAEGSIDVVIGTHGLLAEKVMFSERLGLVVIDEQHRLGVAQRLALASKSGAPHLLTVSATPIPRTLALAMRGELALVNLDERPPGRAPVETELVSRSAWSRVVDELATAIADDEQAFVICASLAGEVGDDGAIDESAPGAETRAKELAKRFAVAFVHGRLGDEEKRAAVASFREGRVRVLVGTSVLEVGIDVPNATRMIVDGADRFGLAQLHQLRGRVGRGPKRSRCVLVHREPLTDLARARLEAIARTHDGLEVARADLALRGPGDLEGARQSGEAAGFRHLDPLVDHDLFERATQIMEAERVRSEGLARAITRLDADAAQRERFLAKSEAG